MTSQPIHCAAAEYFSDQLQAARTSDSSLGELLQGCRDYLLLVANEELPPDIRQKVAASDLVQETFVDAQEAFPGFPGAGPEEFRAWLRRILLNNATDAIRRYRHARKRDIGRELHLDAASAGRVRGLVSEETSPSRNAHNHEERDRVIQALTRLSDEHQRIIELRNIEQLTFIEIGRLTHRTPSAARMLWIRAIRRLTAEVGANHDSSVSL